MDSQFRSYQPGLTPLRQFEQPRVEAEAADHRELHAQDHWRVNLAEDWEITFWAREFGCSEEQLKAAVQVVGDCAGAVRAHLSGDDQPHRRN